MRSWQADRDWPATDFDGCIMKLLFVGLFLLLLGGGPVSAAAVAERKVVIATGEHPPLLSEKLEYYGVVARIITEAFAYEGVTVEYQFYPWVRAYKMSEQGTVDGTAYWYLSDERKQTHLYSDPMFQEKVVWFHRKMYPFDWEYLTDLKNTTIGAVSGYTYTDEFYQRLEAKQLFVEFVSRMEQNFEKLIKDRIDIYPESELVGYHYLFKTYSATTVSQLTHHPKPFFFADGYLLFSKARDNGHALRDTFNRGLQKLRDSGRYDQFLIEAGSNLYLK